MTGQRALLSGAIGRMAVGLVTVAAVVLLAPVAAATPESDADGAITQAWDASGGLTGPLGAKEGGVYPVGEGFGQNFAGGKVFFTPATGAHVMHGVILEKYESLGGPADSDLGWPTIDEGPGLIGPDSRNSTFSAGDEPVIFWTPATGARVVRGAINAAWDKLGGSAGPLGVPVEDEAYRSEVVTQKFTGGELSWNPQTKAFTTVPPELAGQLAGLEVPDDPTSAINAARRAAGGPMGPLGDKKGEQYDLGPDGVGQDFAGGKIFYSPSTGAHVVTGQVLAKYESVGGPLGDLGFPTSSEADGGLEPASRTSTFAAADRPVIFWTPDHGAVIVRGAMNAAWAKLGGATGELGAPEADQTENGDVITQRFTGGEVSWDSSTKAFSTDPPNLASSLTGLEVPEVEPPQTPDTPSASDTGDGNWLSRWWWLLVVVPVLLALGSWMALRDRGRRDEAQNEQTDEAQFVTPDDAELGVDPLSAYAPAAAGPRPASGQDYDLSARATGWGFGTETLDTNGEDREDEVDETPLADDEDVLELQEDPDAVDTAPTRIESDESEPIESDEAVRVSSRTSRNRSSRTRRLRVSSRTRRVGEPIESDEEAPGSRHEAVVLDEPASDRMSIHLPLEDPYEVPEGYPIKADTKLGLYWAPDSAFYESARAEIWFASEEFALTNGFLQAGQPRS